MRQWPRIWVEGQISEIRQRQQLVFITLRDADTEMSIPVVTAPSVVQNVERGSRIAALVGTEWWTRNGQVQFRAHAIQPVGMGELLLRLEQLRTTLAAEGLFAPERKRPLPVLPNRIGLICGRNSEALHDVVTNATKRWPHVQFEIAEVAVQGASAVQQVTEKLREFEADTSIDVIVIARGGGSFEDLLPFSDEGLVREVSKCFTPVVSAIGHEQDRPLLDDVADLRASTPTDAARRIVPDLQEHLAQLEQLRRRTMQRVGRTLDRETQYVLRLRTAIDRAHPARLIDAWLEDVQQQRIDLRRNTLVELDRRRASLHTVVAQLRALSPQATLERGFAVVRTAEGIVVTDPAQLTPANVDIRVARGTFTATPILESTNG
jgi:exodeoxyribonuclease VII large subunit